MLGPIPGNRSGTAHAHELPDDGTGQLDDVVAAAGAGEVVYLTRAGHRVAAVVPPAAAEAAEERQAIADAVLTRMVARAGAPSLEHYHQVYESLGIAWPGDDEVRRLYPVSA